MNENSQPISDLLASAHAAASNSLEALIAPMLSQMLGIIISNAKELKLEASMIGSISRWAMQEPELRSLFIDAAEKNGL